MNRRSFLKAGGIFGLSLTGCGFAAAQGLNQSGKPVLSQQKIRLPNLPAAFVSYRIGFISDLHLSTCSSSQAIELAISMLNGLEPNLVLLGGDYIWLIDRTPSRLATSLQTAKMCSGQEEALADSLFTSAANLLSGIEAPDGVLGVLGNHDVWLSKSKCRARFGEAGISILVNEEVYIRRGSSHLKIYGADDYWTGVPVRPAWKTPSSGKELRVFIAHNPDYISETLQQTTSSFDLALAGHTHGGQIRFPGVGPLFHNIRDTRFFEGLVPVAGGAQVYISRGVGEVGVPVRINCPPEVTLFELLPA